MHVMRDRAHVVEEFGIDWPLLVLPPDRLADNSSAEFLNRIFERKSFAAVDSVAETFIGRAVIIGGRCGAAEPALINAASVQTKRVQILRVELEALAGLEERSRHPAWREAQQSAGFFQRCFNNL